MNYKETYKQQQQQQQCNPTNMDAIGGQKLTLKISQEITECNNSWMLYLQALAGLCAAGARVSHSLQTLSHGMPVSVTANQCRSAWDEMLRATQAATHAVRAEVTTRLRELAAVEETNPRASEQIMSGSLTTLINLQYQFCVACCECLSHVGTPDVSGCQAQQQQQQASPSSELASARQHQLFTRLLSGQRRWSEVAARRSNVGDEDNEENAPRRWSVPWEGPGAGGVAQHQLAVPLVGHERSSRSTTPDSASLASQEELQDVISLLSCRPATHMHHAGRQLPGVTLTSCNQSESRDVWPQGVQLFPRDGNNANSGVNWYQSGVDTLAHSECQQSQHNMPPRRGGSPRPTHHPSRQRSGWTPHEPLYNTIWGEQEGELPSQQQQQSSGQLELFPPNQQGDGNCSSFQRKSSSSTDSSSSSSLPHNIPNTSQCEQRPPSHLYSMWSGTDVSPSLPFIQLSSNPLQGATADNPGTLLP